jgi:hypothetical protein
MEDLEVDSCASITDEAESISGIEASDGAASHSFKTKVVERSRELEDEVPI